MRVERFKNYLRDRLVSAGHPDIVSVDTYDVPEGGATDLKVTYADGVVLYLRIVRTAPPGGDSHDQPEKIVTKQGTSV